MFDWRYFLALADELAGRDDEASKRTAISRAYYCTFNRARQLLEGEGVALPDDGRIHTVLWGMLERAGRARKRLGVEGKRLRNYRRKADYDVEVRQIDKDAEAAMILAKGMSSLLDAESASTTVT